MKHLKIKLYKNIDDYKAVVGYPWFMMLFNFIFKPWNYSALYEYVGYGDTPQEAINAAIEYRNNRNDKIYKKIRSY